MALKAIGSYFQRVATADAIRNMSTMPFTTQLLILLKK